MENVTSNVFTETKVRGCNPSYVTTSDGVVVIDTPQLPTRAVEMRREVEAIGPVRYLINTEHLQESSDVARLVQTELGATRLKSRGVKQALFVVLTGVQMPAALVEIGFVTSARDERALAGKARRDVVAALERAVLAFGRRYDARRGAAKLDPGSPAE